MNNTKHSKDSIFLENMTFYAYHGVNPEERRLGQRFVVDLWAKLDLSTPGHSDALADTVSYSNLYQTVKAVVEGEAYNLLEAVAEAVAHRILASSPIYAVLVRVKKPSPPIKDAVLQWVGIEIYRSKNDCSNAGTSPACPDNGSGM